MKVEEAETKVCPFMQDALVFSDMLRKERFYEGMPMNCLCIAGDCMAWQWATMSSKGDWYKVKTGKSQEGYCKRLDN